jgi:hypothetical protein
MHARWHNRAPSAAAHPSRTVTLGRRQIRMLGAPILTELAASLYAEAAGVRPRLT